MASAPCWRWGNAVVKRLSDEAKTILAKYKLFCNLQGMIPRKQKRIVQNRLKQFPAVAIRGPRQCGKTTLAKMLGGIYFDMENPADQQKLDIQWEQIVNRKALVILDEAQCFPEIFSRLRGAIDEDRKQRNACC